MTGSLAAQTQNAMQATKEMALDVFPDGGLKDIAACRTDKIGRHAIL